MPRTLRRRSLWWTVPLYTAVGAVIALAVWTVVFWLRVGGALGWAVVAIESVVALLLAWLLVADARRQWTARHEVG